MSSAFKAADLQSIDWAAVMIRTAQVVGAKTNLPLVNGMAKYFPVVLEKFSIDTPEECAAFVSQSAVESAWFRTTTEYASGSAYEGRTNLGNTRKGDGVRYKGRGIFQTTGRANYTALTKKMNALGFNVDFVKNPTQVADPEFAVWSAGIYWGTNKLERFASNPRRMSRAINRGNAYSDKAANHEAERVRMYDACLKIMQNPPKLKTANTGTTHSNPDVVAKPPSEVKGSVAKLPPSSTTPRPDDHVPPPVEPGQQVDTPADAPQDQPEPVQEASPAEQSAPVPSQDSNPVLARYKDEKIPLLAAVQKQLRKREWPCGDADGTFGNLTRDALLSYEATYDLPIVSGILDTVTMSHVMGSMEMRPLAEKRKNATANSPELKESKTISYGQMIKRWAIGVLSIVGINIASDATPSDWASSLYQNSGVIGEALRMVKQVTDSLFTSKFTVAGLLAILVAAMATFIYFRVFDHRNGNNLGR